MQGDQKQQQDYFALPIIRQEDSVADNSNTTVDYLSDSITNNISPIDSIFQLKDLLVPRLNDTTRDTLELRPSIFFPFKEKPIEIKPRLRIEANYDWLTGLFVLCLIILTWVKYESGRRVTQIFKAVFARHNMNQLLRDGDIIHERITPGLMFLSLISISTLALLLILNYNINIPLTENNFLIFSLLASAIFILWMLKLVAIKISGAIFRTRAESSEYLITNLLYNVTAGIVAFPFVLIGHYAENQASIIIAVAILALGIIARFIRSIFVGLSAQSFSVVYIFLYLCTLEILPILVLYKLLIN
jgi:hypothetical protein